VKIEYAITEGDYVEGVLAFCRRKRHSWVWRVLYVVFGVALSLMSLFAIYNDPENEMGQAIGVLLGLGFIFCALVMPSLRLKKHFRKSKYLHDIFTLEFSDEAMRLSGPNSFGELKWAAFTDWLETPKTFVCVAGGVFYILPKHCFQPTEEQELRELLKQKVQKATA
jgi:YcxB-like protein